MPSSVHGTMLPAGCSDDLEAYRPPAIFVSLRFLASVQTFIALEPFSPAANTAEENQSV